MVEAENIVGPIQDTPFNFQPFILIGTWIILAVVLYFITWKIKRVWLRGAILGLLIPLAIFSYGAVVPGFGGLVWQFAYAPIAIIPGMIIGGLIGLIVGKIKSKKQ
jgi:uncharacterized membrane protein YfhO